MSDLLGAVALSGDSITELLGMESRRAMLELLPGYPKGIQAFERGPLWLCGPSDKVVQNGECCIAAEGWIAQGKKALAAALETGRDDGVPIPDPDGHYVLAHADSRNGTLTLLRSLSGGERLYYLRLGEVFLFAASVRPLLAHPGICRKLNSTVLNEVLLTGQTNFGCGTLFEGIDEVLPGHSLTVVQTIGPPQWRFSHSLRSPKGSVQHLAREFREALGSAVSTAIGTSRPVAVALSGGIDSSAVAAAAVEAVGADNVHAFTWEFDDPSHPTETHFAVEVSRRLGISHHHIFKVSFEEFIDSIPEVVWHSESFVHWPKSFLLPVARRIRQQGFTEYLTGFGIGSHMGYLDELARVLRFLPWTDRLLRYWKLAQFGGWGRLAYLGKVHPGLELPHPRLYYLLLVMLQHRGYISDVTRFYPPEMKVLVSHVQESSEGEAESMNLPLRDSLQLQAFAHLISCIDITRSEKSLREGAGVNRISPAHFNQCIPYAYFPVQPPPFVWSGDRDRRPGKLLLQRAYRDILPESVLFRKKSWDDAVVSRSWLQEGRSLMLRAVPDFPTNLSDIGPEYPAAVRFWEPRSINATGLGFAFWRRMFLERPLPKQPPTWDELLA